MSDPVSILADAFGPVLSALAEETGTPWRVECLGGNGHGLVSEVGEGRACVSLVVTGDDMLTAGMSPADVSRWTLGVERVADEFTFTWPAAAGMRVLACQVRGAAVYLAGA